MNTILTTDSILFDEYKILYLLKTTKFSNIYVAEDLTLEKKVVIKEPRKINSNKISIDKLFIESEFLNKINHPNIIKSHGFYKKNDECYLIMNYVEGRNLLEVRRKKNIESLYIKEYSLQLLQAIEYLHNSGIIHMDIKPENLLIGDLLTLIDFGAARSQKIPQSLNKDRIGTVGYRCPELESGIIKPVCDIYSVAATIYFLISGKKPDNVLKKLSDSPNLKDLFKKALEKDVSKRVQKIEFFKSEFSKLYPIKHKPYIYYNDKIYEIGKNEYTIGRSEYSDLKIIDPKKVLSPIHVKISQDENEDFWLFDNSRNGTFLYENNNYIRKKKHKLNSGDSIALCYNPKKGPYKSIIFRS